MRPTGPSWIVLVASLLSLAAPAVAVPRPERRPAPPTVLGQRPGPAPVIDARALSPEEAGVSRRTSTLLARSERLLHGQVALLERSLRLLDPADDRYPDYLFRLAEHYRALSLNDWLAAMALGERLATIRSAPARPTPAPARPRH